MGQGVLVLLLLVATLVAAGYAALRYMTSRH
jgi:hypothetical protein